MCLFGGEREMSEGGGFLVSSRHHQIVAEFVLGHWTCLCVNVFVSVYKAFSFAVRVFKHEV